MAFFLFSNATASFVSTNSSSSRVATRTRKTEIVYANNRLQIKVYVKNLKSPLKIAVCGAICKEELGPPYFLPEVRYLLVTGVHAINLVFFAEHDPHSSWIHDTAPATVGVFTTTNTPLRGGDHKTFCESQHSRSPSFPPGDRAKIFVPRVNVFPSPPRASNSPDLNAIENCRLDFDQSRPSTADGEIVSRIHRSQCVEVRESRSSSKTNGQLQDYPYSRTNLTFRHRAIDVATLERTYNSMETRMHAVIESGGEMTDY